jgi:hypothetical protein
MLAGSGGAHGGEPGSQPLARGWRAAGPGVLAGGPRGLACWQAHTCALAVDDQLPREGPEPHLRAAGEPTAALHCPACLGMHGAMLCAHAPSHLFSALHWLS